MCSQRAERPLEGGTVVRRKPRILLIPNVAWWIVGEMGKQIIARFGDKYEFYFLPEGVLERRPDLLASLLPAVDAIHCLNESAIALFRDYDRAILPPIATWIHHVTKWSPEHQMATELSSALTVCTAAWREYLEGRLCGQTPITVVPHGIDAEFFRRTVVRPKRFGIPAGSFVLGFVGSKGSDFDGGRKGTDVLLEVARRASARIPNLHIVLGGPGWETEVRKLKEEGLSVSASGYLRTSDLPRLYSALDVYLLTSRVEGGPCTVFEAMACETAVVATRVGAVPEIITDGVNGFSAEVDDVDSLVSAIVQLARFPEKKKDIATAARETVCARSWDAVLRPLEDVYDGLIERRIGVPQLGPAWMKDSQALLGASCAADALAYVVPRIRKGSISVAKGLGQLREMLRKQSMIDIMNGAAMFVGVSFRAKDAKHHVGNSRSMART
jgi:glycosyltransferase involved in cell wall biosynthesis